MGALLRYRDRAEAGQRLGLMLERFRAERPVILGLARGGIPVAAEVAKRLEAPLDVMVARKIPSPDHPEFAIGAVAGGIVRLDERVVAELGIPRAAVVEALTRELREAKRRDSVYRGGRPPVPLEGRTVIVVDDGLATGWTARATLEALRQHHPRRLVFAAPVCASQGVAGLQEVADEVVCASTPDDFRAVSVWYADFLPTTDGEVIAALDDAASAGTKGAVR